MTEDNSMARITITVRERSAVSLLALPIYAALGLLVLALLGALGLGLWVLGKAAQVCATPYWLGKRLGQNSGGPNQ